MCSKCKSMKGYLYASLSILEASGDKLGPDVLKLLGGVGIAF